MWQHALAGVARWRNDAVGRVVRTPRILPAVFAFAIASFAAPASAEFVYTLDQDAAVLRIIDSTTGATLATRAFTFDTGAGFQAGLALAYRRADSTLFVVADTGQGVVLARVPTVTCSTSSCVMTVVGALPASAASRFTGLVFSCDSPPVLYGVTGTPATGASRGSPEGGPSAHALFVLNQTTAAIGSPLLAFADGTDGPEEIAATIATNALYRFGGDAVQSFSRVDLAAPSATPIPTSNGSVAGIGGMTWLSFDEKLLASSGTALRTITLSGDIQAGATMDHAPAGLATTAPICSASLFANGFE